jgi:hypothetical protein
MGIASQQLRVCIGDMRSALAGIDGCRKSSGPIGVPEHSGSDRPA